MRIIDVSLSIYPGMPTFPGDPEFSAERVSRIEEGDVANLSVLRMGTHTGTHIDPPLHFVKGGKGIDALDLDRLIGPALLLDLPVEKGITRRDLEPYGREVEGRILLLKTRNSDLWTAGRFTEDYAFLTAEAAEWIASAGVRALGFDWLSIEDYGPEGGEVHRILLGKGIPVIEGLDFRGVEPGEYTFFCLPLRIRGGDGGPARAVLIQE
jgi:arylformamidase